MPTNWRRRLLIIAVHAFNAGGCLAALFAPATPGPALLWFVLFLANAACLVAEWERVDDAD